MENEKNKALNIPKSEQNQMYLCHFGTILSNISIVTMVVGLLSLFVSVFIPLLTAIWIMFWFVGIVATCGIIFLLIPNYASYLSKAGNFLSSIPYDQLTKILKICLPVGIVLAIASIVCLSMDKRNNHKGRIVFSYVTIALLVATFIFIISGVLR